MPVVPGVVAQDTASDDSIRDELAQLDLDDLSPRAAFDVVCRLKVNFNNSVMDSRLVLQHSMMLHSLICCCIDNSRFIKECKVCETILMRCFM